MERPAKRLRSLVSRLWQTDAPLTGVGLLMLGALAASLAGLILDPRTIAGAPAWMKPVKFAASTAIYSLTLAWIFAWLDDWPRTRQIVGRTTAGVFVLEVGIIDLQAWRGTTSHFNLGTPLDGVLWTLMGLAIVLQTALSVAVAAALWRQRFSDRALGWALRLGLSITIVGASAGGLMTRPTVAQLEEARISGSLTVAGGHTVGAPDGGPGLPATGWSLRHGDLRMPHFLGLHAVQALPIVACVLRRRRYPERARVGLVLTAAAGYGGLFAILLWQALRGQALVRPDVQTLVALAIWACLTAVAAWTVVLRRSPAPAHAL